MIAHAAIYTCTQLYCCLVPLLTLVHTHVCKCTCTVYVGWHRASLLSADSAVSHMHFHANYMIHVRVFSTGGRGGGDFPLPPHPTPLSNQQVNVYSIINNYIYMVMPSVYLCNYGSTQTQLHRLPPILQKIYRKIPACYMYMYKYHSK